MMDSTDGKRKGRHRDIEKAVPSSTDSPEDDRPIPSHAPGKGARPRRRGPDEPDPTHPEPAAKGRQA